MQLGQARHAPPAPFLGDRERLGRAFRYALAVFLAVRIGLSLAALVGMGLIPRGDEVGVPGHPAPEASPGFHNLLTAWERQDALWYLRIAETGYDPNDGSPAFFPLYPALIKVVALPLFGHELLAAILVSNAAFLTALTLLYLWTQEEWGDRVAQRSTLYLAIFPSALIFLAPYAESLFLLLVVASLRAARQARWPLAGGLGSLAALTRSLGLLVAFALLAEAVHQAVERRQTIRAWGRSIPWTGLPALGTLAYLGYWKLLGQDPLLPFRIQSNWGRAPQWPTQTLLDATRIGFDSVGGFPGGYMLFDWVLVVPMLVPAAWLLARARPSYGAYVWASVLVPLTFAWDPRPLMSVPRFLVVLFPLFWALAVWTRDRDAVHQGFVVASTLLLGLTTVLYSAWYFVF